METNFSRRDLLKVVSAAALAMPLALPAAETGAPLFFSKDEFALLDQLSELIIPTDEHSPGAHAAGVAGYIDKSVAEAFLPEAKSSWRKGLAAVNGLSQSMHGKPFVETGKEEQVAVLKTMSAKEGEGDDRKKSDAERFFGQLKNTTVFAYYTTSIGIHQEINYKGNVLLDKFVGYMPDDELPPISTLLNA
jgi:hypothetical protein